MPKKVDYKLGNRYNTFAIKDCLDEALIEVTSATTRRSWKTREYTNT